MSSFHLVTKNYSRSIIYLALLLFALPFLLPIVVMILNSFKGLTEVQEGWWTFPSTLQWETWSKAWGRACIGTQCNGLAPYFLNSVKFVLPSVFLSTLIGAINGHLLSHWRFKGDRWIFLFLLMGMFIPLQSVIIPLARVLNFLGLENSTSGLVLVHTAYGIAFTTLYFRNYYMGFPGELVNAARIDGASFFRIFFSLILPLSLPMVMVSIIWQFTHIWNDYFFGAVLMSGDKRPLTVALYNLVSTSTGVKEYHVEMAAALLSAIPTLLIYIVMGKHFMKASTAGAVKGSR